MAGAEDVMNETESEMNTDRHRGRPRNEAHDEAILDATLELVAQVGIAGLTVDAVAHLAGVGKATIYRRWNSKEALLLDAWNTCLTISDVPDTGSLRGDMEALFAAKDLKMPAETMKRIFPQLIAAAKVNPDVGDTYKAFVEQRRLPMRMVRAGRVQERRVGEDAPRVERVGRVIDRHQQHDEAAHPVELEEAGGRSGGHQRSLVGRIGSSIRQTPIEISSLQSL